jgi:hypothetical protein
MPWKASSVMEERLLFVGHQPTPSGAATALRTRYPAQPRNLPDAAHVISSVRNSRGRGRYDSPSPMNPFSADGTHIVRDPGAPR